MTLAARLISWHQQVTHVELDFGVCTAFGLCTLDANESGLLAGLLDFLQ